ncbi:hypothetical protein ACFQNF_14310 [Iodobacter arcticus]|uniref:DNA-3-methyladenine glycosylase II n=1 Tax=Iodobacter arcticus TaxID=590593 RepID=A0ABW2R4R1_9NEIS
MFSSYCQKYAGTAAWPVQHDCVSCSPPFFASTLSALATAFEADPNLLSSGSNVAETCTKLLAIAGIGDWTSQYIAMRQLREPDAFPASGVALIKAITQREGPCKLSTRAEAWRPWRAYAAQHLWTSQADTIA